MFQAEKMLQLALLSTLIAQVLPQVQHAPPAWQTVGFPEPVSHLAAKPYPRSAFLPRHQFTRPASTRLHPLLSRTNPRSALPPPPPVNGERADRLLPCCKDISGGSICRSMKNKDPRMFAEKCASEPDFSLVVCCKACNELGVDYRERGAAFFSLGSNSTHCFDRMSQSYCGRFQAGSDAWDRRRWSCSSENYRLGFRVCRETCGFCDIDWKRAKEGLRCQ